MYLIRADKVNFLKFEQNIIVNSIRDQIRS